MGTTTRGLYRHEEADLVVNPTLSAVANALAASFDTAWVAYSPSVAAETGTIGAVSLGSCRYKRFGSTVIYSFIVDITTAGSGAGALIVGAPFTAAGTDFGTGREPTSTGVQLVAYTVGAAIYVRRYDNATIIGSGRSVRVTITYEV